MDIIIYSFVLEIWFMLVLAYSHRNNLGMHCYAPKEPRYSATVTSSTPVEQEGGSPLFVNEDIKALHINILFHFVNVVDTKKVHLTTRNFLGFISRLLGCETSMNAAVNSP